MFRLKKMSTSPMMKICRVSAVSSQMNFCGMSVRISLSTPRPQNSTTLSISQIQSQNLVKLLIQNQKETH